jgi:mannitol/fructose-specific phosphotransferase system IIA component (Ntr-type)
MNSLLDALQEGRLLELPDNDKERSLQLLSCLIEAIPSLPAGTDVAGLVMAREKTSNTTIGMGWACPHARIAFEGDLFCAIGWSPTGIDYGIPNGPLVRLIVMYLVPENQKNYYLKEVSMLARALKKEPGFEHLEAISDLNEVRNRLLDLISSSKEVAGPEARARMIQLETRESAAAAAAAAMPLALTNMLIEPVSLVVSPGTRPVVLTQNRELLDALDNNPALANAIALNGAHESAPWRVLRRGSTPYQGDRVLYDCLAIRPTNFRPQGGR